MCRSSRTACLMSFLVLFHLIYRNGRDQKCRMYFCKSSSGTWSLPEVQLRLVEAGSAGQGCEGCSTGMQDWHSSACWRVLRCKRLQQRGEGQMRQGSCLTCMTSVATRSGSFGIFCCSSDLDFQPLWQGEVDGASPTSLLLQHNRTLGRVWHFSHEQRLDEAMGLPSAVSLCLRT